MVKEVILYAGNHSKHLPFSSLMTYKWSYWHKNTYTQNNSTQLYPFSCLLQQFIKKQM